MNIDIREGKPLNCNSSRIDFRVWSNRGWSNIGVWSNGGVWPNSRVWSNIGACVVTG